uniref:Uncharacterized protein n=1 Tax=Rhizophora mucronata TaxID=61149 RepID=A0A2P2PZ37_RHIMU
MSKNGFNCSAFSDPVLHCD